MGRGVGGPRRRRELLDAARDVFAERGYALATVDDIVSRVPVARGTFYLYFGDKRAALEALIDDLFERITAAIRSIDVAHPTETPVAQLRANLERIVGLAIGEPATLKLLLRDARSVDPELDDKLAVFYAKLATFLDESLEIGQRIGLVRDGDRRVMVAIGLGGLSELMLSAIRGVIPRERELLVDEMMRFLGEGLLAGGPRPISVRPPAPPSRTKKRRAR